MICYFTPGYVALVGTVGATKLSVTQAIVTCFNSLRLMYVIIGSDTGLSPVRRQAIIWINDAITPLHPKEYISMKYYWKVFLQEDAFENVVCKMAPICLSLKNLAPVVPATQSYKKLQWSDGNDEVPGW